MSSLAEERPDQSTRGAALPARLTRDRSSLSFAGGVLFIFVAIFAIARINAQFYPLPNEDDARFFYPAWTLAAQGTLSVPMLNAPEGIFWMPHGFYLWLAFWLRLFGPTMEVARTACQLTTAAAAALLVAACARLCRSRVFALLSGLLLVSPGIIFAANTVRMESLVLLVIALGVLLHTYNLRGAAAAVFFVSCDVHPALTVGALLYTASLFFSRRELANRLSAKTAKLLTLAIIFGVACAISAEALYVSRHLAAFHEHMAYQVAHKGRHSLSSLLVSSRGALLAAELAVSCGFAWAALRWPRAYPGFSAQVLPLLTLLLGLSAYAVFGREIPYNLYAYAVVPALYCCLLQRAIDDWQSRPQLLR